MKKITLKKWQTNLALITVVLVVMFFLLEGVVRIVYQGKYAQRPQFRQKDDTLIYKMAPNLDERFFGPDFSMTVKTDAHSARLSSRGPFNDKNDLVLIIGASVAFGWGVDTDDSYPARLDHKLAKIDENLRVVNLSAGGYGTFQSALRLQEFVRANPGVADRVKAVIVEHTHADFTRNVKALLVLNGFYRHSGTSRIPEYIQNRSSFHLVNFVSEALSTRVNQHKAERKKKGFNPKGVDDLSPFHIRRVQKKQSGPVFVTNKEYFPFESIAPEDYDLQHSLKQKRFSKLQIRLLRISLARIHCALGSRKVPIYHFAYHQMPLWYYRGLSRHIKKTNPCGNRIRKLKIIDPITLIRSVPHVYNAHSGGHMTPEANNYYATFLLKLIKKDLIEGFRRKQSQ